MEELFFDEKRNKLNIPENGKLLAADDKVFLKMLSEEEYDSYIEVSFECSNMKSMFKDETFKKDLWNEFKREHSVVVSIYDKDSEEYVGYCSIKDIRKNDWEIAIEEKVQYRKQGYGYHALKLFFKRMHELTNHRFFCARIEIDNIASQKLWKKLGAYPNGISEFWLHGEDLIEFQKENVSKISDHEIRIAKEFGIEPEELIGHILEYKLDTLQI